MTTVGEEMTTGGEDITTLEPEDTAEPEEGSGDVEVEVAEEEDSQNVIIVPSFDFTCTGEGLFGHDSNCAKFWLCKGLCHPLYIIQISKLNVVTCCSRSLSIYFFSCRI